MQNNIACNTMLIIYVVNLHKNNMTYLSYLAHSALFIESDILKLSITLWRPHAPYLFKTRKGKFWQVDDSGQIKKSSFSSDSHYVCITWSFYCLFCTVSSHPLLRPEGWHMLLSHLVSYQLNCEFLPSTSHPCFHFFSLRSPVHWALTERASKKQQSNERNRNWAAATTSVTHASARTHLIWSTGTKIDTVT